MNKDQKSSPINGRLSQTKSIEQRKSEVNESRFSERDRNLSFDRVIYRFKVILIGDIAVGKTSILSRFVDEKYTSEYRCNVGVEFKVKSLYLDEKTGADLQIWDTCGQEIYRSLITNFYRNSSLAMMVYSIDK